RRGHRRLILEPFEERILFAVSPQFVAAIPSQGTVINNNDIVRIAPTELTLRFDSNLDPNSLTTGGVPAIQFLRGGDHQLGNGNDVTVVPGFYGIGLNPNEVIARFDQSLPDDLYQIKIVGTGAGALKGTDGTPVDNGTDVTVRFSLDLGAQVVAVVPQP